MTTTFYIQTKEFTKHWNRLGCSGDDFERLVRKLYYGNVAGFGYFPKIRGTGGLRRTRFAFKREGKRESVKVYYVDCAGKDVIYFITVYPKREKDNLSKEERDEIKKMIAVLRASL